MSHFSISHPKPMGCISLLNLYFLMIAVYLLIGVGVAALAGSVKDRDINNFDDAYPIVHFLEYLIQRHR